MTFDTRHSPSTQVDDPLQAGTLFENAAAILGAMIRAAGGDQAAVDALSKIAWGGDREPLPSFGQISEGVYGGAQDVTNFASVVGTLLTSTDRSKVILGIDIAIATVSQHRGSSVRFGENLDETFYHAVVSTCRGLPQIPNDGPGVPDERKGELVDQLPSYSPDALAHWCRSDSRRISSVLSTFAKDISGTFKESPVPWGLELAVGTVCQFLSPERRELIPPKVMEWFRTKASARETHWSDLCRA